MSDPTFDIEDVINQINKEFGYDEHSRRRVPRKRTEEEIDIELDELERVCEMNRYKDHG